MPREITPPASGRRVAAMARRLDRSAGAEVQLLPAGEFRAADGRPQETAAWRLDAAGAERLIAAAARRATPYVIDYEHQTLMAAENGRPAPRAATFAALKWREGKGLFAADVVWTKRARDYIEADEYGFISPVFSYDPDSGEILALHHAALTNDPALDGMDAVTAAASRLAASLIDPNEDNDEMNADLLQLLGLDKDAEPAAAVTALTALVAERDQLKVRVAAAKQTKQDPVPDPAEYAPVAALKAVQDELAALKAKQTEAEVDALVRAGLADGRLLPAMEAWARDLGKSDVAALRAYLDKAAPVAALRGSQTGGKAPDEKDGTGLTAAQLAVCKAMGLDPKIYKDSLEVAA